MGYKLNAFTISLTCLSIRVTLNAFNMLLPKGCSNNHDWQSND